MNSGHIAWCRSTFNLLRDGGQWGVPRSGLIFTRRDDTLVLTEQMPYDPAMPITEAQLHEQQASDYESTRLHFEAAGIRVVRAEETTP